MTRDEDEGVGLRERKKRATRVALSQATIRLCVERGWDNVTVEDIAAAADVSVRTFRNYFSGKAEAIAAAHVERMHRVADELRVRPADEPLWQAVAAAVTTHFAPVGATGRKPGDAAAGAERGAEPGDGPGRTAAGPAGEQEGEQAARDRRWRDGLRLMLAEPALQGEIVKASAVAQEGLARAVAARTGTDAAKDVYPKLVAAVISAGSSVAMEHSLGAEEPTPVTPVLVEVFEQLAAGLPVPPRPGREK